MTIAASAPVPGGRPVDELSILAAELQRLQRRRAEFIRARVRIENNRSHLVAMQLGYHAGLTPDQRKKLFKQTDALIEKLVDEPETKHPAREFVQAIQLSLDALESEQLRIEKKEMIPLAKNLPKNILEWIAHPDQDGVSLLYLAVILGETGDLRGDPATGSYMNPGKVWRRLGCAPWTYQDKTLMGATWKAGTEGKLPGEQWSLFGYSPRRRSIAYMIGLNLKMKNKGPYRARYDEVKARVIAGKPEWTACVCCGTGETKTGAECPGCLGKGFKTRRCDRHAMLLATKLFLKNLWKQFNKDIDRGEWQPPAA